MASGDLPLSAGWRSIPGLFGLGAVVAAFLPWSFAAVLLVYVLLTSYSWRLKQVALLDVFVLAGLYTIRLIAGTWRRRLNILLAAGVLDVHFPEPGVAETVHGTGGVAAAEQAGIEGRGYVAGDWNGGDARNRERSAGGAGDGTLCQAMRRHLYRYHMLLLMMCPLLMFWVSRVWLLAHRGQMHDDPVVFALKDGVSY